MQLECMLIQDGHLLGSRIRNRPVRNWQGRRLASHVLDSRPCRVGDVDVRILLSLSLYMETQGQCQHRKDRDQGNQLHLELAEICII